MAKEFKFSFQEIVLVLNLFHLFFVTHKVAKKCKTDAQQKNDPLGRRYLSLAFNVNYSRTKAQLRNKSLGNSLTIYPLGPLVLCKESP